MQGPAQPVQAGPVRQVVPGRRACHRTVEDPIVRIRTAEISTVQPPVVRVRTSPVVPKQLVHHQVRQRVGQLAHRPAPGPQRPARRVGGGEAHRQAESGTGQTQCGPGSGSRVAACQVVDQATWAPGDALEVVLGDLQGARAVQERVQPAALVHGQAQVGGEFPEVGVRIGAGCPGGSVGGGGVGVPTWRGARFRSRVRVCRRRCVTHGCGFRVAGISCCGPLGPSAHWPGPGGQGRSAVLPTRSPAAPPPR